jgi:hypothetical protein
LSRLWAVFLWTASNGVTPQKIWKFMVTAFITKKNKNLVLRLWQVKKIPRVIHIVHLNAMKNACDGASSPFRKCVTFMVGVRNFKWSILNNACH